MKHHFENSLSNIMTHMQLVTTHNMSSKNNHWIFCVWVECLFLKYGGSYLKNHLSSHLIRWQPYIMWYTLGLKRRRVDFGTEHHHHRVIKPLSSTFLRKGCARRVHCSMCAVFSVARSHTHVVSPSMYCHLFRCSFLHL